MAAVAARLPPKWDKPRDDYSAWRSCADRLMNETGRPIEQCRPIELSSNICGRATAGRWPIGWSTVTCRAPRYYGKSASCCTTTSRRENSCSRWLLMPAAGSARIFSIGLKSQRGGEAYRVGPTASKRRTRPAARGGGKIAHRSRGRLRREHKGGAGRDGGNMRRRFQGDNPRRLRPALR
jgi:hypothetical protein